MARINGLDPRNPTLHSGAVRVNGFQFIEADQTALGVYTAAMLLPAYSVLLDIRVHAEELWDATSASLQAGIYLDSSGVISTVTDADRWFTAVDLAATDLTKGQMISFLERDGGVQGTGLSEGSDTHFLDAVGDDDRWIVIDVTTGSAVGTAGETYVYVLYATPEMDVPTFVAA